MRGTETYRTNSRGRDREVERGKRRGGERYRIDSRGRDGECRLRAKKETHTGLRVERETESAAREVGRGGGGGEGQRHTGLTVEGETESAA